jgi:tRNA(fMet)-specific endonuclease VapC
VRASTRLFGAARGGAGDAAAADAAARARNQLEGLATGIGPIDVQIAGIALAQSATLVTRNVREFSRAAGLLIDNWYDG